MIDPQIILNLAFALAGAFGGFILRAMWSALTELRRDLQTLQSSIASTYVRREDWRDHAARVESILQRIEIKLDGKADRP